MKAGAVILCALGAMRLHQLAQLLPVPERTGFCSIPVQALPEARLRCYDGDRSRTRKLAPVVRGAFSCRDAMRELLVNFGFGVPKCKRPWNEDDVAKLRAIAGKEQGKRIAAVLG